MKPEDFWQEIVPIAPLPEEGVGEGAYMDAFPVELGAGQWLRLPIRPLPDGQSALASLIINQASFVVQDALADALTARLAPFSPEIVVGLPTLGLTLAAAVARRLGHARSVPLGTSRKFWYREDLSVALSSVTTPDQAKRLYIDPRMLPLIDGRRVALVDDVISSGTSIVAGLGLLSAAGVEPVVVGAAMLQGQRWREKLDDAMPDTQNRVVGVFSTPILRRGDGEGWMAEPK